MIHILQQHDRWGLGTNDQIFEGLGYTDLRPLEYASFHMTDLTVDLH